ncbi:MAG: exonuclease SbcCD subunit D [Candidatus Latescibacteria bacterium]|nr:exonuclease SbcCD subunit D [Candidatus Latescibacterota bacterium]
MSLKILHIADIHMGMENYGRLDPATGLHTRLQDFSKCLSFAVDTGIEEKADLVLFAGDAYRTCDPTPTHQRAFAAQFRRFSDAGIPVVMIIGNHDNPVAYGKASSIDIFGTLGVTDIAIISKPEKLVIQTKQGAVQVACLPWPTKSTLLTKDEYKDLSETEIRQKIEEICTTIIQSWADDLDPSLPSFLLAHITAADARLSGTERSAVIGHDPTILTSVLANPAFDYCALGHVHRFQDLNPRGKPRVVYPGSIERVDFGEEQEEKGFCLVELDGKEVQYRFIPTPARPFITIDVTISPEDEQPTHTILREIERRDLAGAIVRVIYTVPEELQHKIDLRALRAGLDQAFLVASIVRKTETPQRIRRAAVSEELSCLDALDRYFENNPDLESYAADMKRCAQLLQRELEEEHQASSGG